MVLRQSILALLRCKPIGKITVKELCERADVNRATFYAHYTDAFDLLNKIEDELIETIKTNIGTDNGADMTGRVRDICEEIKENADLCNILFGEFGNRDFIVRILEIIHDLVLDSWRAMPFGIGQADAEFAYAFTTEGSVGIIRLWQQNGFDKSPDEIAGLIMGLTFKGLVFFVEKQA
jgi:AcrR family transcriptional regulator